jgi:glycosyltransferase involved in cell wall biosynthesis
MRVLQLMPCRFWGGPEKQTLQLSGWLRDHRGVETVVAVMPHDTSHADENPLLRHAHQAGFETTLFTQKRPYDLLEGLRLLRTLVARHRPDVVCATGYKADVIASALRDVPTIATARGWTAEDAKVRFFEWLDRKTLRRHDAITVVSRVLRDEVLRHGVAPDRVFWVPNAIDPDRLPPRRQREDLCREIGMDPERPILGSVGRLSPEKGHRILLEAFSVLRHQVPGAQLVLVGDGPEEAALREQAKGLGLSGGIAFMGLRRDGQQIVAALDVLALPSFSEGMPNVVLEAFAYGTPVVATSVGGVPDMMADAQAGWLVPADDPARLAGALAEALTDRQEAEGRAQRARMVLAESFTVEKQAHAWLRATDTAVGARSKPPGPS